MKRRCHTRCINRDGSVYLVTLITVAAIASMVLIGVSIRSASSTKSTLIEKMSETNLGVMDATEYALEVISSDSEWKKNAQTGVVFPKIQNGDGFISSSVLDADTLTLPTLSTTNYRVRVATENDTAYRAAQIDVQFEKVDYLTYLTKLGAFSYWALNESKLATEAVDQISSLNGTYKDPTVVGTAQNDEGAPVPLFNDNKDHVRVGWDSNFEQIEGTISLWMRYDGPDYSSASPFLGMLYEAGVNPTINMAVYNSSLWVYLVQHEVYNIRYALSSSSGSLMSGKWYHIAMSWGSSGLTIYIDGVRVARDVTNHGFVSSPDEKPLLIGKGFNMFNSETPGVGFEGSLAHIAFISGQLSDSEISELAAIKPDLGEMKVIDDSWVTLYNE